jgi:hypothetical protein
LGAIAGYNELLRGRAKFTVRLTSVKRFLAIAVLFCYYPLGLAAQETTTVSITVKVLNGKTGKPVWRESPNIWIDKEPHINPYTKIKVSSSATQLWITPDFGHECRWKDGDSTKMTVSYSIVEILRTGVVSQNFCGAPPIAPAPGVLVFYELPSTWRERWYN